VIRLVLLLHTVAVVSRHIRIQALADWLLEGSRSILVALTSYSPNNGGQAVSKARTSSSRRKSGATYGLRVAWFHQHSEA